MQSFRLKTGPPHYYPAAACRENPYVRRELINRNSTRPLSLKSFHWQGIDNQQQPCHGTVRASNKNYAEALLIHQGIIIKKIYRSSRYRFFQRQRIKTSAITQLLHQLALMLNAGISLLDSLTALTHQQHHAGLQQMLAQLQQQIKQGNSFSTAVEQQCTYFDTLTCRLITAGEQSGNLEQMLQRAADYRQRSETLKQRIRSVCLYPAIALTTATVVTLILLLIITLPCHE
ncbi:MAG: hypothetical protein GY782_01980 [Gammaproteobacteria bacterium]|nr:hypothetical protein [Gammaproteobacteria bacterium]